MQRNPSFESRKKPIWNSFSSALSVKVSEAKKITYLWMQIYFLGCPACIGRASRSCLFIIFFASVQTSCLDKANRIDLPAFFSIPCSHEPSKECMLLHAVLMNGVHLRVPLSQVSSCPACSFRLRMSCLVLIFPRHSPSRRDEPFIRLLTLAMWPSASTTKTLSL